MPTFAGTAAPDWEPVVSLIEAGRYDAALAELDQQIASHPPNSLLLRLKGRVYALQGNRAESLLFLRAAVNVDPGDQSARYFLAQALAESGDVPAALSEVERLTNMDSHSPYAMQARRWAPELTRLVTSGFSREFDSPVAVLDTSAENLQKRWSLALRSGLKYDSNVPQRADAFPDFNPRSSWGLYMAGYGSFDLLSPEHDNSPIRLGVSVSGYQLWYTEKSLAQYDVTGVSVRPYASWQSMAGQVPFQISVDGSWDVIWLGGDYYNRDFTASATLDVQWFSFLLSSLRYKFTDAQYDNDTLLPQYFSRDGGIHDASIGLTTFLYKDLISLGATYGITVFDTQGSQFQSVANRVEMYAGFKLPWDFDLTLLGGFQSSGYYAFTPTPGRLDSIWTAGAVVRRKIWKGLSGEVAFTFIGASSDQLFAQYTRNVVDFALIYEF